MEARLPNPAELIPDVLPGLLATAKAARQGGVPETTLELIHQRVSQINGCSVCVHGGAVAARRAGVTDEQLFAVAAWRDSPLFDEAERAALELAESMTRQADRSDPVPDDVWSAATKHYDDTQLASLVISIGLTNLFNRVNAATRQVAGATW